MSDHAPILKRASTGSRRTARVATLPMLGSGITQPLDAWVKRLEKDGSDRSQQAVEDPQPRRQRRKSWVHRW